MSPVHLSFPHPIEALVRFPLAAAMLASWLWLSYLVAVRWITPAAPHLRPAASMLAALWLQAVVFTCLSYLQLFRLFVAAPLCLTCAALAHWKLSGQRALVELSSDVGAAWDAMVEIVRSPLRAPVVALGSVIVGSRLLRDLVSPPLAWDGFLYHLYKPARWIHYGGQFSELAPDNWGYLEYFPEGGDIPWAWSMLPVRGDALIAPAGIVVWSACLLGAYALARQLGAPRISAGLAALAVGFIPAAASVMTSSYADNFVLASLLLSSVFMVRLVQQPSLHDAALAAAGLGLLASAKLSGLPVLALGLLFIAWHMLKAARSRADFQPSKAIAIVLLGAGAVSAPGYLRAWIDKGSPFYPLTIAVAGRVLIPGNEELRLLYSGLLHDLSGYDTSWAALFRVLTIPTGDPTAEHTGFGYGWLGLVVLGTAGAWLLYRERVHRAVLLFLAATAILPLVGLMSDSYIMHRTYWQGIIGRLVMALPAALAVFAARVPGRAAQAGLLAVIVSSYAVCIPKGFGDPTIEGMIRLAAPLALALVLAILIYAVLRAQLKRRQHRGWLISSAAAGVLAFLLAMAVPLSRIRADLQYAIYAAHNSSKPAFQIHTLDPRYASAWPIWQYVDDGAPHRIALAAGWDGVGHNWYRYPLAGSRFQNEVVYVPVTTDGSVIDYREYERVYDNADIDAWLGRLVERRVDLVVILYPWPIEQYWIQENPALFEPVATSPDGINRAYRFHAERLRDRGPESPSAAGKRDGDD